MDATTQQSKSIQFITLLKWSGQRIVELSQQTYHFGQEIRTFVDRMLALSETLADIKTHSTEIEALQQKIQVLENGQSNMEALKAKLYKCECKLVLLEKGRRFTHRNIF